MKEFEGSYGLGSTAFLRWLKKTGGKKAGKKLDRANIAEKLRPSQETTPGLTTAGEYTLYTYATMFIGLDVTINRFVRRLLFQVRA